MFAHESYDSIQFPTWLPQKADQERKLAIDTGKNSIKDSTNNITEAPFIKNDMEGILQMVSEYFSISSVALRGRRKEPSLVFPRATLFYLSVQYTECSLVNIGLFFGHRSPATVKRQCLWLQRYMNEHPAVKLVLTDISRKYITDFS